jgi:hypothetical protein
VTREHVGQVLEHPQGLQVVHAADGLAFVLGNGAPARVIELAAIVDAGGEGAGKGETTFCHSLNNPVLASPRFLVPLLEMYQNADGSVTIPPALRPYMGGKDRIALAD